MVRRSSASGSRALRRDNPDAGTRESAGHARGRRHATILNLPGRRPRTVVPLGIAGIAAEMTPAEPAPPATLEHITAMGTVCLGGSKLQDTAATLQSPGLWDPVRRCGRILDADPRVVTQAPDRREYRPHDRSRCRSHGHRLIPSRRTRSPDDGEANDGRVVYLVRSDARPIP